MDRASQTDSTPGMSALRPVAFVLSGGTSLGAIQVGMLQALYERGVAPDLILGSSAGAVNGAFIALRDASVATTQVLGTSGGGCAARRSPAQRWTSRAPTSLVRGRARPPVPTSPPRRRRAGSGASPASAPSLDTARAPEVCAAYGEGTGTRMSATPPPVLDPAEPGTPGGSDAALSTRAFEERRVAPERVRALAQLEAGLQGRLKRRPVLFGAPIVVGEALIAILVGVPLGAATDLKAVALIGAICVAGLLWRQGWWREVGFGGPSSWRSQRLLIVPAVWALLSVAGGLASLDLSDPAGLALNLPQNLLTGFSEEGLTRGLLLSLLLVGALRSGRGPVGAVLISAVVFGLLHLVNDVIFGTPQVSGLLQVVFAIMVGIWFGALLLRTNALWALAGLHGLFNAGSALKGDNDNVVGTILVLATLLLAAHGLFLLRRVKRDDHAVTAQRNSSSTLAEDREVAPA